MRWIGFLAVVVACGGDDGTGTGDDDDTTEPLECNLPQYELETLSCDALAGAWRTTVEAGNDCNTAADCVVLRAPCETWWQVGCFYATRADCVDADLLATFSAESGGCNINGDSCSGCGTTAAVDCVAGECVVGDG